MARDRTPANLCGRARGWSCPRPAPAQPPRTGQQDRNRRPEHSQAAARVGRERCFATTIEGVMSKRVLWAVFAAAAVAVPGAAVAQTFAVQKFNVGGDGGTDYLTAEPGTGRVFVSRGSHVMVIDAA